MTKHFIDAMRGAAALAEMLDCIGAVDPSGESIGDHAVAKILVESEMQLRALLHDALDRIAEGG